MKTFFLVRFFLVCLYGFLFLFVMNDLVRFLRSLSRIDLEELAEGKIARVQQLEKRVKDLKAKHKSAWDVIRLQKKSITGLELKLAEKGEELESKFAEKRSNESTLKESTPIKEDPLSPDIFTQDSIQKRGKRRRLAECKDRNDPPVFHRSAKSPARSARTRNSKAALSPKPLKTISWQSVPEVIAATPQRCGNQFIGKKGIKYGSESKYKESPIFVSSSLESIKHQDVQSPPRLNLEKKPCPKNEPIFAAATRSQEVFAEGTQESFVESTQLETKYEESPDKAMAVIGESTTEKSAEKPKKVEEKERKKVKAKGKPMKKPKAKGKEKPSPQVVLEPLGNAPRGKARKDFKGKSCPECEKFYKMAFGSQTSLLVHDCSRHRGNFRPPATPEGFWDISTMTTTPPSSQD